MPKILTWISSHSGYVQNSCIRLSARCPNLKCCSRAKPLPSGLPRLGEEIARDFRGQSIIFVGVLKGAAIFLSDLARHVPLDATFDFIGVSSYGNRPTAKEDPAGHAAWDSLGEVRLTKDMDQSLADRNVILVEDILDTGLTLNYISKTGAGASTEVAAHCGLARQAFTPQAADPGAIHRLHDSRCLRGRLRPGLRGKVSQSSGYLRARKFVIGPIGNL